jgi:DNA polymerase-4
LSRWVLHVDMDAFFASVEQALDPTLRGKPVIVGGQAEDRGVVSTASYEARRYGVRSAMPTSQAKRLCPQGVFLTGNFPAYEEYSRRIVRVLESYSPLVEPTSIDEAYLDVTGCEGLSGDALETAHKIKAGVREETNLTCSVGVGPNRLLAKMASGLRKPDGLTFLTLPDVPRIIWPKPVGFLPGVGPSTAARLETMGLVTVGDLAQYPADLLTREFGTGGRRLRDAANGLDDTPVAPAWRTSEAKSLSRETTFAADLDDLTQLERVCLDQADQLARRLRRHGARGRTVTIKIKRADFTTVTRSRTLAEPTDLAEVIYETARETLVALFNSRSAVRLLGLAVSQLEPAVGGPQGLFDASDKLRRVSQAVDRIKERYGETAMTRARLLGHEEERP